MVEILHRVTYEQLFKENSLRKEPKADLSLLSNKLKVLFYIRKFEDEVVYATKIKQRFNIKNDSYVAEIISQLEAEGYIYRKEMDGYKPIYLTETGKAILSNLIEFILKEDEFTQIF